MESFILRELTRVFRAPLNFIESLGKKVLSLIRAYNLYCAYTIARDSSKYTFSHAFASL